MQTGDGLLARLVLDRPELTGAKLIPVLRAAARHGNGRVEITLRGNLQIRGLTETSAIELRKDIAPLGLTFTGLPISTGALAGIDSQEIANPLPLADAIRQALTPDLNARLAPKTSIVIDGGGQLPIDGIKADIRLSAVRSGRAIEWLVAVGGNAVSARPVCQMDTTMTASTAIELLKRIASKGMAARGRDLGDDDLSGFGPAPVCHTPLISSHSTPVGIFDLVGGARAIGIGLPFGAADADALADLVAAADGLGVPGVRFAPGRALLFTGVDPQIEPEIRAIAEAGDFVTQSDDPRLSVSACMGAPGCAAGEFDTRGLAAMICSEAAPLLDGSFTLHLSGCSKRCADVAGPKLTLMGNRTAVQLLDETGREGIPATEHSAEALPQLFCSAASRFRRKRGDEETARNFLQRCRLEPFVDEHLEHH